MSRRALPAVPLGSGLVVAFWVAMALGWRLLAPADPFAVDPRHVLAPPSWAHWLGTDQLGRDVLSRTLAGSASVLLVAPAATLLGVAAGTVLGLAAGWWRGATDLALMRLVDALISVPAVLASVLVLALLGRSTANLVLVIGLLFAPLVARTVRAAVLVERARDYVDAARLRREPGWYVMAVEILPNVASPIMVEATVRLGYAVFAVGTLSFLGLGPQPPSPDWGLAVAAGRGFLQVAPWLVLAPAVALSSLVVAVNLLADRLREAVASG